LASRSRGRWRLCLLGSRKTESGAKQFLAGLAVRAAPFALRALAIVRRDRLLSVLLELGLLLPFVHLGF
jgi:hypothetical protein